MSRQEYTHICDGLPWLQQVDAALSSQIIVMDCETDEEYWQEVLAAYEQKRTILSQVSRYYQEKEKAARVKRASVLNKKRKL